MTYTISYSILMSSFLSIKLKITTVRLWDLLTTLSKLWLNKFKLMRGQSILLLRDFLKLWKMYSCLHTCQNCMINSWGIKILISKDTKNKWGNCLKKIKKLNSTDKKSVSTVHINWVRKSIQTLNFSQNHKLRLDFFRLNRQVFYVSLQNGFSNFKRKFFRQNNTYKRDHSVLRILKNHFQN